MAEIKSIDSLLEMNINIPDYQRPYKWSIQNIQELLVDISTAIEEADKNRTPFKYRIGTIILHERNTNPKEYDVVDGQQRLISIVLIKKCLDPEFECSLSKKEFSNKISQTNIHNNFMFIHEWFSLKSEEEKEQFKKAFSEILEVVVICVNKVSEAFQLFDSQNTRGKNLDPHDLLKAYHLREMKDYPYEMEHAVKKWESKDTTKIRELFDLYLFPIWNWSRGLKSKSFTDKDIDTYKGVSESSTYSYAKRANKATPCFQITEPFVAGNDFFEMVDHYLNLLRDIKTEILRNNDFKTIKNVICGGYDISSVEDLDMIKYGSTGFAYTCNLFYCALLCYYDKFHNFDVMAVKKLFTWAFMLRVDMETLGYGSINKYAIGDDDYSRYSNSIAMFSRINLARLHTEISSLQIKVPTNYGWGMNSERENLFEQLKELNGLKEADK